MLEGVAVSVKNNVFYVTDSLNNAILHVSYGGAVVTLYKLRSQEHPKAITLNDEKG